MKTVLIEDIQRCFGPLGVVIMQVGIREKQFQSRQNGCHKPKIHKNSNSKFALKKVKLRTIQIWGIFFKTALCKDPLQPFEQLKNFLSHM